MCTHLGARHPEWRRDSYTSVHIFMNGQLTKQIMANDSFSNDELMEAAANNTLSASSQQYLVSQYASKVSQLGR